MDYLRCKGTLSKSAARKWVVSLRSGNFYVKNKHMRTVDIMSGAINHKTVLIPLHKAACKKKFVYGLLMS